MSVTERILLPRCDRCGGRMLAEGEDGDSACFTCGNVLYGHSSLITPYLRDLEKHPSRGGQSLS